MPTRSFIVPIAVAGTTVAITAATTFFLVQRAQRWPRALSPERPMLPTPVSDPLLGDPAAELEPAHLDDAFSERGEEYDAVSAEELGAEWLARATETLPTHREKLGDVGQREADFDWQPDDGPKSRPDDET